ncbi:MAG: crossover junction endodeoxyribonuclease RuvC [Candidatus Omnitrophica bacterium]|nr:crossover junction endodeoxyribonuclease RuvC [Candidatus Omnitrophota bacterium]
MLILGVDPGLKATGYGLVGLSDQKLKVFEAGSFEPKQKNDIEVRLQKIHVMLTKLVQQYRPQLVVLEKLYAHYKHPLTASKLGHVRGVICLCCAENKIPIHEYSVKRIRKAVVGNGNATKIQTRQVVSEILSIDPEVLTLDASDALALAVGYSYINRVSI